MTRHHRSPPTAPPGLSAWVAVVTGGGLRIGQANVLGMAPAGATIVASVRTAAEVIANTSDFNMSRLGIGMLSNVFSVR